MMGSSRWKPLPANLPDPARELAERLRASLDRAGLSLRRLAADDEVHYSVTALHRFLSGQALPPRQLVDVVARRCGDGAMLSDLHDRACTDVAGIEPITAGAGNAAHPGPRRHPRRWWILALTAAAVGIFVAGTVVGAQGVPWVISGPVPGDLPSGTSLLQNGTFDHDSLAWWTNANVGMTVERGILVVDVPDGSDNARDRMIGQTGFALTAGRRYALRFDGVATCKQRDIRVVVARADDPFEQAYETAATLSPHRSRGILEFISPVSFDRGSINFQLGGHPRPCTFLFDNIDLVELPSG